MRLKIFHHKNSDLFSVSNIDFGLPPVPLSCLLIVLGYLFLGALSGCNAYRPQVTPDKHITEVNLTSASLTPLLSNATPTQTPRPAISLTPFALPPTLVSLPTYEPDESRKILTDLYENAQCRFPCWWGITPGVTDWQIAWQFLSRISINQELPDFRLHNSDRMPAIVFFDLRVDTSQLPSENKGNYPIYESIFFISTDSFKVKYISLNTGNLRPYTIPQILSEYGRPEQIYVRGENSPNPNYNSITIYMYYPQYGFMSAHFTTVDWDAWDKPVFTACFQKYTRLILWPVDEKVDFTQMSKINTTDFHLFGLGYHQNLDQVTNYSVEEFYQTFVNSADQPCLELNNVNLTK